MGRNQVALFPGDELHLMVDPLVECVQPLEIPEPSYPC